MPAIGLSSISFVYLFLPVSVLVFYAAPSSMKNGVLLGISLVFYAMADPIWLLVMLLSVGLDFVMASILEEYLEKNRAAARVVMGLCVAKALLLILWPGVAFQLEGTPLPLGIQVYTLTALGYMVDIYRGDAVREKDLVKFGLFCCFFGKLFAGPLVSSQEFLPQLDGKRPSIGELSSGLVTFSWGFAKQVILAVGSYQVYRQLAALPGREVTILSSWMLIVTFTFAVYFVLSGYCDMARGLGQLFGLDLPRNFYYPFQSRTVQDFFNRFNITFNQYVRRYVVRSLGGEEGGFAAIAANVLFATILMGLWFGISLNFVVWGVYFALFLLLEKYLLHPWFSKIPPLFLRVYTFCVVMLSFTIFAGNDLVQAAAFLCNMFAFGRLELVNNSILYILAQNYGVILLCFIFATSILEKLAGFLHKYLPRFSEVLSIGMNLGVLLAATAMLL